MRTTGLLLILGIILVFLFGLLYGVWHDESDPVPTWSIVLLMIVAPSLVLAGLVSSALWRQVSAPALVGALIGGVLGAAWVIGLFSSIAVTDRTLAEYGSDESWESLLTFQLTLWISTGSLLGFVSTWVIRIVAGACSWFIDHSRRPQPNHRSPV